MKNRFTTLFLISFFSLFSFSTISGQELEETLSNLSSDAAQSYVAPIVSGFGSNLNSGWFSYPPDPVKLGFTLRARIVGSGTFFSSDDETFSATGSFRFSDDQADAILQNSQDYQNLDPSSSAYQQAKSELLSRSWNVAFSGPTIIGNANDHLLVEFQGDEQLGYEPYNHEIEEVNGYLDGLSLFPSGNLQLTVGTVMGTNLVFRWFPSVDIEDLGKFEFFGIGGIHNTNVWFDNPLPVDLSVGAFYQSLTVGDVFESSATKLSLYASKTFGGVFALTPYVGLSTESSETTVSYQYTYGIGNGLTETADVELDLEGENSVGFTVGLSLKLAVVNLNVDYKAAKTGTLTAGLSIGIL